MTGQRTGFYSIRKHARLVCKFIFLFTPVIKKLFPNETALHNALDTANDACSALVAAIDLVAEPGV